MNELKLLAVDAEDIGIVSAHVQDAVVRAGEMSFLPAEKRFVLVMNRFAWETAGETRRFTFARRRSFERRRAVLHFDRVLRVRQSGLTVGAEGSVLALLAIRFLAAKDPSGTVELVFAGGAAIRLEVECVEAQLTDLGAAWSTDNRPDHDGRAGATSG